MMARTFLLAGMFGLTAAAGAEACPDNSLYGTTIERTGAELWQPERRAIVAGGGNRIAACPLHRVGSQPGWVATRPDLTMHFSQSRDYQLTFEVERADCDTVLLVNTGNNNWYYNDDAQGGLNARIALNHPSEGWYDIWVGTYGQQLCDAVLKIETFNRDFRGY